MTEKNSPLVSETGLGKFGTIVVLLLFAFGAYAGNKIFPFFYSYWELQGIFDAQAAKASEFSDQKIRDNIMKVVRETGIPLENPEEIKINRTDQQIIIDLSYQEVFFFSFQGKDYDLWVFTFEPHAEYAL